jgi:hypothetical protein
MDGGGSIGAGSDCGVAAQRCVLCLLPDARTSPRPPRLAGRPLPPLFNWIDGELQQAAPELHAALQPRPAAASP